MRPRIRAEQILRSFPQGRVGQGAALTLSAALFASVHFLRQQKQLLLPALGLFVLGWALGLRLLVGPLIATALIPVFGFTGQEATIMIVSSSFPTAVNTALIAHEFQADSHFAAAAVFYSTLFSMFTVTILIAVLR